MKVAPKIDSRDFQKLLDEAKKLVPFYVPEWNINPGTDSGMALLKIFFHILQEVTNRLNEVPEKNLVAFLDMLGMRLIPSQPAKVPAVFQLVPNAPDTLIPAQTQSEAPATEEHEALSFETDRNILATTAALTDIYSLVPAKDEIFNHFQSTRKSFELFSSHNQQEHAIYLGHDDLFNIKGEAVIQLKISPEEKNKWSPLIDEKIISWQYYGKKVQTVSGQKVETTGWYNFSKVSVGKTLTLSKDDNSEIIPYEINGVETRWLRCLLGIYVTITDYVPPGESSLYVDSISNIEPGDKLWIIDLETLDDTERTEFVTVKSVSEKIINGILRPSIDIYGKLKYSHNNGIVIRKVNFSLSWDMLNDLEIDEIELKTSPKVGNGKDADLIFSNDVPVAGVPFYPFGKLPRLYDTFYIASQEAFSKKGATIELNMDIKREGAGIPVERVQGVGDIRASRLNQCGIKTIDQLILQSPEDIARILGESETEATNILEATKKEFYDKTPPLETLPEDNTPVNVTLSYEYWDGKGWKALKDLADETDNLVKNGIITFTCSDDVSATSVVGQENYWIRIRIVDGDYGREKFILDSDGKTINPDTSEIDPPWIEKLSISYKINEDYDLQYCLIHNNLEYQDMTQKSRTANEKFQPFISITDTNQALYLGFDKPLVKGPISLFFSLDEQRYPNENRPRVQWYYYYSQNEKPKRLDIVDETDNLTQSGTIKLIAPSDFALVSLFGKKRYWLKAIDIEDRFQSKRNSDTEVMNAIKKTLSQCDDLYICPEESQTFSMKFMSFDDMSPNPKVKGIYVNSTWMFQTATIQNEILGSSDGTQHQAFRFGRTVILSEEIQVNEMNSISEEEKSLMRTADESSVLEVKDDLENIIEVWIKWQRADDFLDSKEKSRHYVINKVSGEIQFGDGVHGMVPPIGRDNIRATYQSGGGKAGNVNSSEIRTLKSSIPFVDKVSNPENAGGGSDTEELEMALERGSQSLKNRGRAVTFEDYEWLTREASPNIARVKCLPGFNTQGKIEPGWVTLVLVPESIEEKPFPSPLLLKKIEQYLKERCSNVVSAAKRIQVMGPAYIKVSVKGDIYPVSVDLASVAEKEAIDALKAFLHPLNGGFENTGWDFGKMLCLSNLYHLLEGIAEIDHVDNLSMILESDEQEQNSDIVTSEISIPSYALIYSGEHELTPKPLPKHNC